MGYVERIFTSREKQKNFQFVISNGHGKTIQVVAWNNEKEKLQKIVTETDIVS